MIRVPWGRGFKDAGSVKLWFGRRSVRGGGSDAMIRATLCLGLPIGRGGGRGAVLISKRLPCSPAYLSRRTHAQSSSHPQPPKKLALNPS